MINKVKSLIASIPGKTYSKDIIVRLLLYSVAFIEILCLPLLLDTDSYAQFEYLKNAVFIFPLVLIGGHSGYTYTVYKTGSDDYSSLFNIGVILSTVIACIVAIIMQNAYIIIPCLLINVFTIIEQRLKIKKSFITAFFFKPLLSFFTLCTVGVTIFLNGSFTLNVDLLLLATFLLSFSCWYLLYIKGEVKISLLSLRNFKKDIFNYSIFVKKILTGVMASMGLAAYFFIERMYVDKFYHSDLPSYSLSFNIVQILIIVLTTLTYISGNVLGEKLYTIQRETLVKYMKTLLVFFIFAFLGITLVSFILNKYFFTEYSDLFVLTSIVGYAKGFVFLVSVLTPLAVYNDFNNHMFICVLILFVLSNIAAYILYNMGFSLYIYLFVNSLILIIYPLFNLDIIFRRIKYNK